jgi:DNA-binding Xre family transcriptional regulator
MSKIRNRFEILLAQKQVRDGRQYTYDDIYAATGISPNTITSYTKQRVTRFDSKTVSALCDWLECDLSELLEYPPVTRQQKHTALASMGVTV